MKYCIAVFYLLVITCISHAQTKDELAIRSVLTAQVAEWNKGNIDNYMQGYWNNDSLIFIGKNGPTYGYANTLTNYRNSYPDTAYMGQLDFEIISIKKLSTDYYFAIGKWALKRSAGNVNGAWTLLFRKINGYWKIVADHSS